MPTYAQLGASCRITKRRRLKSRALDGAPHRKGIIYKVAVMPPRKPNSARRTFAKVRLIINNRRIFAKIPGIGDHFLQNHALVLVRGHGPKDSPGYKLPLNKGFIRFSSTRSLW